MTFLSPFHLKQKRGYSTEKPKNQKTEQKTPLTPPHTPLTPLTHSLIYTCVT